MRRWASREVKLSLPDGEYAVAAAGLTVVVLFLFRGAVFGGQVLFLRDINMVWYPLVESFVRCVAGGSWPLWDSYGAFGRPLLADPRAEILYPPTWLNLLMLPWTYYTLFVAAHLVLSGIGFYAACRRLGISPPGSFTGAAVWTASGPLLSLASVWHHLAAAAWMPWVFLAGEVAIESGRIRHGLLWAAAIAAQLLAGSPEITLLTAIAMALRILTRHVQWRAPSAAPNRRLTITCAIALGFALGLSAGQWLPSLEVARRSGRWNLPYEERTSWSLHPLALLEVILPLRFSDLPPGSTDQEATRELQAPWLHSPYLGIPAFALIAASLAPRRPGSLFWWCLCGGAVLFALGRHSFAYSAAVSVVPPLGMLRFPVKAMIVAGFCWSVLAGKGFDAWRTRDAGSRAAWLRGVVGPLLVLTAACSAGAFVTTFGAEESGPLLVRRLMPFASYASALASTGKKLAVGACLSGIALALAVSRARQMPRQGWIAGALSVLVIGDLMLVHRNLHPAAPKEIFTRRPEVLDSLEKQGYPRLYVYDYSMGTRGQRQRGPGWMKGYPLSRGPQGWSAAQALVLAVHMYLNPQTGPRWGLYGSYDLDIPGLDPAPGAELAEFLREAEDTPLHLRLLRLGAVANVLALHPAGWWRDLQLIATVPGLFAEPIRVFKVPHPLPRAYVVDGVRVADGPRALQELAAADFDPERELIVPSGEPSRPGASVPGTSRILELGPDRVRLEADLVRAGYLVLVDAYDPGWKAAVNGAPATVLRANIAFRAIRLPAGRHAVELVYRPAAIKWGLSISAATLVLVLLLFASRR